MTRKPIKLPSVDTEAQLRKPARKAPRRKCPKCSATMIADSCSMVDEGVIVRERCPDCGHVEESKA
jgi:Zn ribbon nucleic-acid-binding protein